MSVSEVPGHPLTVRLESHPDVETWATLNLDLDSTVFDYLAAMRAFLVERHDVDPDDLVTPTHWDLNVLWRLDRFGGFDRLHAEAIEDGLLATMPLIDEDVVDELWALSEAGVRIRVLTARLFLPGLHERTLRDTVVALEGRGLGPDGSDRDPVPYWAFAVETKKHEIAATALLDDSLGQLTRVRDLAPATLPIAFDQPWNQSWTGARLHGWTDGAQRLIEMLRAHLDRATS